MPTYRGGRGSTAKRAPFPDDANTIARWLVDEEEPANDTHFVAGTAFANRAPNAPASELVVTGTGRTYSAPSAYGGKYRSQNLLDMSYGLMGAQAIALPNTFSASLIVEPTTEATGNFGSLTAILLARVNAQPTVAFTTQQAAYDFAIAINGQGSGQGRTLGSMSIIFFLRTSGGVFRKNFIITSSPSGDNQQDYFMLPMFRRTRIGCSYDGAQFAFYRDGIRVGQMAANGTAPANTANHRWLVGCNGSTAATPAQVGKYEDVVISNVARTPGQFRDEGRRATAGA